jgi:hypothetical protein
MENLSIATFLVIVFSLNSQGRKYEDSNMIHFTWRIPMETGSVPFWKLEYYILPTKTDPVHIYFIYIRQPMKKP